MKPHTTTARPSVDLDATDEFPVLDAAAYEAEVLSRDQAEPSDGAAAAAQSDPSSAGSPAASRPPNAALHVGDSEDMLAVERWVAQKTEELRAHHDALSLALRERTAAVERADELSRELTETRANLEALQGRERSLVDALASSETLLKQRAEELQGLQHTREALIADRQRAARELSELESRLRESEAHERDAQRSIAAQVRAHAEMTQRAKDETGVRERLVAEVAALQAQLASCVESLHSRESYRAIYESTLQELDAELAMVRAEGAQRRSALESRVAQLTGEHAAACAQLLAMQESLTTARHRAQTEALACGAATERQRELESTATARQTALTDARLEIERNRALVAGLTEALLKSQTLSFNQGRLLEEREVAASTMAATHAEQAALIAALRGQVEGLTARMAAPEAERRALADRAAALTKELAEADSRLAHMKAMSIELRATVGRLNTSLRERDAELQRATHIASMNAYALGRVQSSIDELGRTLTACDGAPPQADVCVLTRIGNGQNHSVVLRGRTTIGRDHDNDLPLAMRSVSRHHAVLIPASRSAFVQDLGSTNGVLVNQRRVHCARLEHGDVISFGGAQFRYTVPPAPTGASSTGSAPSSPTRASLKRTQ